MFPGPLGHSLTGRALAAGLWRLETRDIRDAATDRHRTVDDSPAGGGAGMVLRADIAAAALDAAAAGLAAALSLAARRAASTQARARALAAGPGVTLLCGRFEGIDERVLEARGRRGGEPRGLRADRRRDRGDGLDRRRVRLIPRVLGNAESTEEESFSSGLLEFPQYTRPTEWEGLRSPRFSSRGTTDGSPPGDAPQAERLTKERRPDLWRAYLAKAGEADPAGEAELSDAETTAATGGPEKDDER